MKKILNGFRYDTEKAILIGKHEHGYKQEFTWWEAGLFVTKRSHKFFIAGKGNAMSRFSKSNEFRGSDPGSKLFSITKIEALVFAGEYLNPEDYEKYFKIEDA